MVKKTSTGAPEIRAALAGRQALEGYLATHDYDKACWTSEAELSALRRQVGAQHRMLSSYLNAFRRHGLWLEELREPVPASQWADSRPGADRVPVYVAADA